MLDLLNIVHNSQPTFLIFVGILSLIIGSLLNVVIVRLPVALHKDWRKQCYDFLELPAPKKDSDGVRSKNFFHSLVVPRSHCPQCKKTIKFYDNIPVLSYILLRGKCRTCKKHISWRYPIIEIITTITGVSVAAKFGVTWQTLAGCFLSYILIVQSCIDLQHMLIPDEITLPILWLGLLLSLGNIFIDPHTAIIGATAGYLSLWCIYWAFYIFTGKEGMGYGDFKLLAMLGAWLGWQSLSFVVLFSSLLGTIIGGWLLIFTKILKERRIPFGPFIAIAGWTAMLWGSQINDWYLNLLFNDIRGLL